MRNPTVSKVLHCGGKNELKYIKMHKALVFLHYCLERYDCFSIYKIESGRFKFLKFCMQNTAIAYVGGHSPQLLLYTIEYTILHEVKSSSVEVLGKKKKSQYIEIWGSIIEGKEINEERALLACSSHPLYPTTSPLCPTGCGRWATHRRATWGFSGAVHQLWVCGCRSEAARANLLVHYREQAHHLFLLDLVHTKWLHTKLQNMQGFSWDVKYSVENKT